MGAPLPGGRRVIILCLNNLPLSSFCANNNKLLLSDWDIETPFPHKSFYLNYPHSSLQIQSESGNLILTKKRLGKLAEPFNESKNSHF